MQPLTIYLWQKTWGLCKIKHIYLCTITHVRSQVFMHVYMRRYSMCNLVKHLCV